MLLIFALHLKLCVKRWDGFDFITKIGNGLNMHKPGTRGQMLRSIEHLLSLPLKRLSMNCALFARVQNHPVPCDTCDQKGSYRKLAALSCAYVLFNRFYARNSFRAAAPAGWTLDEWMARSPTPPPPCYAS